MQKKREKEANIIRWLKEVLKNFSIVSITLQKKEGEGAHKKCITVTMKLFGVRVKSIWAVLLHFYNEAISLSKCCFVCSGTSQKIWVCLPNNLIWKVFQRLNWQNRIYQSSTAVLLILFVLTNSCKPKKKNLLQVKWNLWPVMKSFSFLF